MTLAIIDYGSGNLRSAAKAAERAAADLGRTLVVEATSDPDRVARADRVILPGVGAFAECRRGLFALDGMVEALSEAVMTRGRPFLGICVGMQLLASVGFEHGEEPGLDWIPGRVSVLRPADPTLKVPHMGWNDLTFAAPLHPVLAAMRDAAPGPAHGYFVHSYHFEPAESRDLLATADYGGTLTAAIGRGNLLGTQFHPEKSQARGLALLRGFLEWDP